MKVVHATESYRGVSNGVTSALTLLTDYLGRCGCTSMILTPGEPTEHDPGECVIRTKGITRLPFWKMPVPVTFGVPRWVNEQVLADPRLEEVDVVHSHYLLGFGIGGLAQRFAKERNRYLVVTYHTEYEQYLVARAGWLGKLFAGKLRKAIRRYLEEADVIVVPSKSAHESVLRLTTKRSIRVIPSGVEIPREPEPNEHMKRAVRSWFKLPADKPIVLYAGRLEKEKNITMLLEAFARIVDDLPDPILVLAGSGRLTRKLQRQAEHLGIASRTYFTGWLEHDTLLPLYATSSVFAFPSVTDTQGLSVAEAVVRGLPCIVTDVGGPQDMVRNGLDGFVMKPEAAEFAKAIRIILSSENLRSQMSMNCIGRREELSAEAAACRHFQLYQSLVVG